MNRSVRGVTDYSCADRAEASALAAELLAEQLQTTLRSSDRASLVVSGGTTPAECLRLLASQPISWARVDVCLTDERRVAEDSELSNARMVRAQLLNAGAQEASLHPLTENAVAALSRPFSAVLVGVGSDGHFASIFPDMEQLQVALNPDGPQGLMNVSTTASPVRRVTMTLPLLLNSGLVVLLAFGAEKRDILLTPGDRPVAALLGQTQTPLAVVWAP